MRKCVSLVTVILGVLALRVPPAGAFQCSGGRFGSCSFVSVTPVSPTTVRVTISCGYTVCGGYTPRGCCGTRCSLDMPVRLVAVPSRPGTGP